MKEETPLFTAEQLQKVPLTYHHMAVLHTVEVKEICQQKNIVEAEAANTKQHFIQTK